MPGDANRLNKSTVRVYLIMKTICTLGAKEACMYVPGKKEAWLAVVTLIVLAYLLATGSL
jgi:hypothetical protein